MRSLLLTGPWTPRACLGALLLGGLLALIAVRPALAAGVVTDCSTYGPGPGTLAAATATDGLITFACSGVIVLPAEIALGNDRHLIFDGSGQAVTISGGGRTRLFNLYRGASLQIHNLTLADGNAGDKGGGAIMSGGLLTITNSSLLSNTAAFGGALELFNGSAFIHNSTLAGNRSLGADDDSGGGAINQYFVDPGNGEGGHYYDTPSVEIVHSTLVANRAVMAGRGGVWQENGRLVIKQSIIAGNENGNCRIERSNPQQFATIASLDDDGTCRAALTADPLLAPLRSEAGAPPTFAPLSGSQAIDAAPAGACAGTADATGALRPRDGNGDGAALCDLGAYEVGTRWMVLAAMSEGAGEAAGDGLAGYWKFDEGAGTVSADSSGRAPAAVLQSGGDFTPDTPRLRFGSPFALSGSGAGIGAQVADAPALNPAGLTLAAWVRLTDSSETGSGTDSGTGSGDVQPLAAKLQEGRDGRGYGLLLRTGILAGEVWDSEGVQHVVTATVPLAPAPGGWLHVALTYQSGGALRLYVNGRSAGQAAAGAAVSASAVPLTIGGGGAGGAVDDVRLYSRALPAGAVAALASGRPCVTTGTTWGDAVPDLQCALLEAGAGDEVWIGPGVYRPTRGPDRTATFAIRDGVGVYGGFAGTENSRTERAPDAPRPVLSGDIGADDRVDAAGVLTDPGALVGANALHVVSISSTLTAAVISTTLEGVTITGGQADDGSAGSAAGGAAGGAADGTWDEAAAGAVCASNCGGGLYIRGGAPQLRGLQLIGNTAAAWGGAIYAVDSDLLLLSAALRANRAGSGGGIFVEGGAPAVANSLVAGNGASGRGGGVYSRRSALRLVNVTVAGNRAAAGGGLLLEGDADAQPDAQPSGSNLIVAHNLAANGAQAAEAQVGGGGGTLQNSLVQGGCPPAFACPGVLAGDPQFATPVPPESSGSSAAPDDTGDMGDYRLLPASPAIDSGDNAADLSADHSAAAPAGATIASVDADLADAPRITAARRLPAQVDLGAYEAANVPPVFTSVPVTVATATMEYVYRAAAVDPNTPGAPLPIEATLTPPWLALDAQFDGAALLHGAPDADLFGYFDVILRSADGLGGATEQRFTISVVPRRWSLYLPEVIR